MIKAFLGKNWIVIVLAVAALGVGYARGSYVTDLDWNVRWIERNAENSAKLAEAERKHRQTEQDLNNDLNNQLEINDRRRAEVQRLQSESRVALDGLHGEIDKLRLRLQRAGSLTGDSGTVSPATRAAMVLSDLYGSCATNRQELAKAFDESHSRGLKVERMYDKARGQ